MIVRYIIFGVLTTAVSLLVYYFCTMTFLDPQVHMELQIANIISWIISVAFAYITNRKFVFQSQNTSKWKECFSFYVSRISTLLMDMALMFILVNLMTIDDRIAKLVVQIIVIVSNYIASKVFVFKN